MAFDYLSGYVPPYEGVFYKITSKNIASPKPAKREVTISNGLTWNKANDKMYYIDTLTYKIVEFDFDEKKGRLSGIFELYFGDYISIVLYSIFIEEKSTFYENICFCVFAMSKWAWEARVVGVCSYRI